MSPDLRPDIEAGSSYRGLHDNCLRPEDEITILLDLEGLLLVGFPIGERHPRPKLDRRARELGDIANLGARDLVPYSSEISMLSLYPRYFPAR